MGASWIQSSVGDGALLGPYAHLRPDSVIGDAAHIGNFVETKKVRMGRGSKANHLSYLGDAVIGAGVNIGAGAITCNYDGVHKHHDKRSAMECSWEVRFDAGGAVEAG